MATAATPKQTRGGAVPSEAYIMFGIGLGKVGDLAVVGANLVDFFKFEMVSSICKPSLIGGLNESFLRIVFAHSGLGGQSTRPNLAKRFPVNHIHWS